MISLSLLLAFAFPTTHTAALFRAMAPGPIALQALYLYQNRTPQETWAEFYFAMASQLAARGNIILAEGMLDKAARLKPHDPMLHIAHGLTLEQLDKFQAARQAYERAIAAKPDAVDGYYRMGLLRDRMGEPADAILWLQKALAIDPNDTGVNYDIGVLFAKQNDYAQSAHYSGLAAKADPRFAEALNNYAYALANLGQFAQSLEAVNRSVALKPDSAASLDTRGFALHGLRRYAEALADYDKALALDGDISEIYLHKAQTLEAMNRMAEAIAAYQAYLDKAPAAPDRADVEKTLARLKALEASASAAPAASRQIGK